MNERIKELAVAAKVEHCVSHVRLQEFAELIIKECGDTIEREYKYALGENTKWAMAQDAQDLLKKHFGIKE